MIKDNIKNLQKYARDNKLNRYNISQMIGVTPATLSKFFTDEWEPKLSTVIAIEKAFKSHEDERPIKAE